MADGLQHRREGIALHWGSPHSPADLRTHPLEHATYPTPSAGGTVVYVVCACGQRRVVPAAEWAQELARREEG
jgi:hypothetical protein